jgi:hypothetical protein
VRAAACSRTVSSLCRHYLKLYSATFLGSDFCSWLVSDDSATSFNVKTREAAVACGLALFQNKVDGAAGSGGHS